MKDKDFELAGELLNDLEAQIFIEGKKRCSTCKQYDDIDELINGICQDCQSGSIEEKKSLIVPKQRYFLLNYQKYSPKNSLQKTLMAELQWLEHIVVIDVDKLAAKVRPYIENACNRNTRCKPETFNFRHPDDSRFGRGVIGIEDFYMYHIIPVSEDFSEKEVSDV